MSIFNPKKINICYDSLNTFLRNQITGNLQEIPYIGEITEKKLKENGINSTHCLIGKYLMFKSDGVGSIEHADRFYLYLKGIVKSTYLFEIVYCICLKSNQFFEGIFDENLYEFIEDNSNEVSNPPKFKEISNSPKLNFVSKKYSNNKCCLIS